MDYKQRARMFLEKPVSEHGKKFRLSRWQKAVQEDPSLNGIILDGLTTLHLNCCVEIACRIVGLDWNSCLRTCKSWNRFFSILFRKKDYWYHMWQLEFRFWGRGYCFEVDFRLPWRIVKMSLLYKAVKNPQWEPRKGNTKIRFYRFLQGNKQFEDDILVENTFFNHQLPIEITGSFGINAETMPEHDKELMEEYEQVKSIVEETGREVYWFPIKKHS